MPRSVAELGSREAQWEGQGDTVAGLTPEEDKHIGDGREQGAAQAAANTHAGAGGLQADHLVHRGHQLGRVFPFQPETGHGAVDTFNSSEEPLYKPISGRRRKAGLSGLHLLIKQTRKGATDQE